MRSIHNRGSTPCGRRIDRRKVLLAAAAALFLSATSVQAGITDFVLDPAVSSLSYAGSKVDLSFAVAKAPHGTVVPVYTAQTDFSGGGANGLVSFFSGHLYADVQPAFIQPIVTGPGGQIAIGSGAPGPIPGQRDGAFIPYDDGYGHPSGTFPNPAFGGAPADWGNFGITVSAVGAFARVWGMSIGPNATTGSNAPMPLVGLNTYALAPQIWGALSGFQDLVSGLGGAHTTLATAAGGGPFPIPLSGTLDSTSGVPVYTPGAGTATYDGVTLTINVNGTVVYTLDNNGTPADTSDDIWDYRKLSGALVYHKAVPEPSTMVLAGCGIVGLLAAVRRSRKRQPLAHGRRS